MLKCLDLLLKYPVSREIICKQVIIEPFRLAIARYSFLLSILPLRLVFTYVPPQLVLARTPPPYLRHRYLLLTYHGYRSSAPLPCCSAVRYPASESGGYLQRRRFLRHCTAILLFRLSTEPFLEHPQWPTCFRIASRSGVERLNLQILIILGPLYPLRLTCPKIKDLEPLRVSSILVVIPPTPSPIRKNRP